MSLLAEIKSKRQEIARRARIRKFEAMAGIVPKEPTRIFVALTRDELTEFAKLARRCKTSVSALGQLAVQQMMLQAKKGAVPMVAPVNARTIHFISAIEESKRGNLTSIQMWLDEVDEQRSQPDS